MSITDQLDGPLRCYGDVEIDHRMAWWAFGCESYTGIDESPMTGMALMFPNPGADHFTLSLSPGTHTITLRDATGRILGQQRTSNERTSISTSQLRPGIYLVSIDEGSVPLRWVKE